MSFLPLSFGEPRSAPAIAPLKPIRRWLNAIEVRHALVARWICRLIPNTCPATHEVRLFGRTVLAVPSVCHINPLQDELVDLRFRAADFLYEYARD